MRALCHRERNNYRRASGVRVEADNYYKVRLKADTS